ncbi:major facilitator superfamily domain-containing protein [Rhodofomes roseus]|uniref:Major facilitator superfamily domain-containing protein n=1 Tax=Rhodofomes roseus TaxID=34475 RepID=A0ABQ8KHV3_9APHY|nr:major facilitator superfamily domain-containing protein [Rhodofomes roseus]KAH9837553.1 major facilitator superfamily domain-containing protein [Rhodofomes roseus]
MAAQEISIPDGGMQAWLSVLGGWLVSFCTFGFASSFGVFEAYYVNTGTSSSSNISWIGSLQFFFLFAMGLPAGKLFDEGYYRFELAFGSFLVVFCIMMLSLADPTKYYQLILAQGIGIGIGSGLLLVPALSIQSHHWRRKRSLAMGIVLNGASFGGIIYPIMLNQLFSNGVGFAWGVRAAGFMTLGLLIIANCVLRTRLPSARQRRKAAGGQKLSKIKTRKILTDLPYMLMNVGGFLGLWGVFLPYFYLQLWVNLHGLSETLAFYTIAILNAASVIGRTIPPAISDRVGTLNMLAPLAAITGALVFVMFAATTPGGVIVFAIFYGAFSGGFIAMLPPTLASMARSPDEVGYVYCLGYCFSSLAMLTGSPISGALLGPENDWAKPIIFSGVRVFFRCPRTFN